MAVNSAQERLAALEGQMAVLAHFSAYLRAQEGLAQAMSVALGEMDRRLMLGPGRVYAVRRNGSFKLLASYGLSAEMTRFADEVERGVGFTGLAASRGKTVTMPVDQLPDKKRAATLASYGIKAVCAVPLFLDGKLVGVLNVATRRRVGFTPEEQNFVQVLAGPLAATVAAVDQKARLRDKAAELQEAADRLEVRVREEAGELAEELDELRQANRRLQENMRMIISSERADALAKFTSVIAHRLRNPLMAIGGFAQRLVEVLGQEGRARSYARAIADQVDDLEVMLNEVFKLQRQKDLDYSEIDPNQAFEEAYQKAVLQCGRPSHEPHWNLAEGLPAIVTDRGLLVSALSELIQNAIEATDGQGLVCLESRRQPGKGVIWLVGDDGPGIPEYERERVFDPLYTTKSLGTGLGMSVCREVMELMGGTLGIEDRTGGGALMKVELPLHPPVDTEKPLLG